MIRLSLAVANVLNVCCDFAFSAEMPPDEEVGSAPIYNDPLYVEIMRDTKGGDRFTVQEVVDRWRRSDGHSRRVLDWMANAQEPKRTMRLLLDVAPHRWERI